VGEQVDQIIKRVGAINEGDFVARLSDGRLFRVTKVDQEYDYTEVHAEHLSVTDVETGAGVGTICASRVTYPLNAMEVLAWAAR